MPWLILRLAVILPIWLFIYSENSVMLFANGLLCCSLGYGDHFVNSFFGGIGVGWCSITYKFSEVLKGLLNGKEDTAEIKFCKGLNELFKIFDPICMYFISKGVISNNEIQFKNWLRQILKLSTVYELLWKQRVLPHIVLVPRFAIGIIVHYLFFVNRMTLSLLG